MTGLLRLRNIGTYNYFSSSPASAAHYCPSTSITRVFLLQIHVEYGRFVRGRTWIYKLFYGQLNSWFSFISLIRATERIVASKSTSNTDTPGTTNNRGDTELQICITCDLAAKGTRHSNTYNWDDCTPLCIIQLANNTLGLNKKEPREASYGVWLCV